MKALFLIVTGLGLAGGLLSCDRDESSISSESRKPSADLEFAKDVFAALARGESVVADNIDWKTFQSLGINVGAEYVVIESETDKQAFRDAFITQFSSAFLEQGGKLEGFTNWRAIESDAIKTVVASDSTNGLLKITVISRDGKRLVSGIDIVR